ncbi:hypothetical protein DV515_00012113 [Chloebia gouldiae]|uniref:Uncharacterized protein n=1 Tax=Chloebia gouldiae TaxID=44316 RepID=A0A3L8S4J1_CHLGU|nr:hypothetical protein DV515_00012113 [Chloebia gouldiae]
MNWFCSSRQQRQDETPDRPVLAGHGFSMYSKTSPELWVCNTNPGAAFKEDLAKHSPRERQLLKQSQDERGRGRAALRSSERRGVTLKHFGLRLQDWGDVSQTVLPTTHPH